MCSFLHHQEAETGLVPSVQDFDKKLAEADAYLQILIDQLKVGAYVTSSCPLESFISFFEMASPSLVRP